MVGGTEIHAPNPLVVGFIFSYGMGYVSVPKGDDPLVIAAHQLIAIEAVVGETAQLRSRPQLHQGAVRNLGNPNHKLEGMWHRWIFAVLVRQDLP